MRLSSFRRRRGFRAIAVTLAVVLLSIASFAIENKLNVPIMPLKDIKTGMKGEALTVFTGTKPEKMDVEVLGILRNMTGPKGDVILVRLHGEKPEYTGVVAGMSGSPVYIDGKLIGALAFRIGEMSKEPIAGVTPIEQMLEINEYDQTPGADAQLAKAKTTAPSQTAGPGEAPELPMAMTSYLKPIDTPLVFNGFSEEAIKQFAPQFAQAGIVPVMGAGSSSSDVKQPEPISAGSSVGAVLVRGDMDIAATCTVTYADADHLLACGHPFLGFGKVEMPMTKSQVLVTLPSPLNAFKIANTTETVGSFVQDRKSGILGRFGQDAHMIPVTLNVVAQGKAPRTLHFEVLNNARMTPVAMMASVYNAVQANNAYGDDVTFHVAGSIDVAGFPKITLDNMYAPADGQLGMPAGVQVAMAVGDRFNRIFDNPYEKADVQGVNLNVFLLNERKSAKIESARTDSVEARPGETVNVEMVLRPYRGQTIVKQVPVKIPASVPRGNLRILISDADTLDRISRMGAAFGKKYDLNSTISMLNQEHSNSRIYVSLLQAAPQATVGDNVMPSLPPSVMNVMDGMRSTQEMTVLGESRISENSEPTDYVVSGQQLLNINIK